LCVCLCVCVCDCVCVCVGVGVGVSVGVGVGVGVWVCVCGCSSREGWLIVMNARGYPRWFVPCTRQRHLQPGNLIALHSFLIILCIFPSGTCKIICFFINYLYCAAIDCARGCCRCCGLRTGCAAFQRCKWRPCQWGAQRQRG